MRFAFIGFAIYLAVLPAVTYSQPKVDTSRIRVSGQFIDMTSAGVAYEAVELRRDAQEIGARTQTDDKGAFYFSAVLPGRYTLTAFPLQSRRFSKPIEINGAMDVDLGSLVILVADSDVVNDCFYGGYLDSHTKKGSASGRVVGRNDLPVPNAIVRITGDYGSLRVIADLDGVFRFVRTPDQGVRFGLAVKALGFETACFGPFQLKKGSKDLDVGSIVMDVFGSRATKP